MSSLLEAVRATVLTRVFKKFFAGFITALWCNSLNVWPLNMVKGFYIYAVVHFVSLQNIVYCINAIPKSDEFKRVFVRSNVVLVFRISSC